MVLSKIICIFVSDLRTIVNSSTNCLMDKDDSNNKKNKVKLTKEYEEHFLLLEGGDKTKHTTFDC